MPGPEGLYGEASGVKDLYPKGEEEHQKLLGWAQQAFTAAESARQPHYDLWKRYYKLYRSYRPKRKAGEWQSRVFIPMVYYVIESLAPRLVASLPKFTVTPVGPEDEDPAKKMEQLLDWAATNSELYVQLVMVIKSALKYGTGILKVYWDQDIEMTRGMEERTTPVMGTTEDRVMDPDTGEPMVGLQGEPLVETTEVPIGMQTEQVFVRKPYVRYEGPKAEAIDIGNFYVAGESEDIEKARYAIQRMYRGWDHIKEKVTEGVYTLPSWVTEEDISSQLDEARQDREGAIELFTSPRDPTRKDAELLEIWTDDGRVITMLNRRFIIRHTENPFDHGRKPFVRFVDVLNEHEFWGSGEIEQLEGLQDYVNAQVNQRIDNVRLSVNRMFAVNINEIADRKQLASRPGGIIEVTGDIPAQQVVVPLDFGDVTSSAYTEVEYAERTAEKVSGVSSFSTGVDSPDYNRTATGAALINDNSSTRFSLKVRLIELLGLRPLARMYGSLLQQFIDQERVIRMLGPDGAYAFETFTPDAIQGALDYDIEAASATETEAIRKDQKNQLLQMAGTFWPNAVPAVFEDLLKEFGIKETTRYILGDPQIQQALMQMQMQQQMMQQQMAAQMAGAAPGMEGPQGPPASGEPLPPEAPQPQEAPVG